MPYVPDIGGAVFDAGDPPQGICVAFDNDTLEADPVWTRLDDPAGYRLATAYSVSRGRQSELDKTGTGTATVRFVDRECILDPTALGPFAFPTMNLDPMKQASIALRNPLTDEWSTIFTGFVSSYEHEVDMWTNERGIDTVTMELADAFDLFAALELTPRQHGDALPPFADFADVYYKGTPSNFIGEADVFRHVDDRFVELLDECGWPNTGQKRVGKRNIFSGNVSLQGQTYARRDQILAAMFDCADAEFPGIANVFMSKTGVFTFHGRFARFYPNRPGYGINTWYAGSVTEAGFDSSVAPVTRYTFRRSKDDIINACLALPQHYSETDLAGQFVKDVGSIAKYGWRSRSFDNLLVSKGHDDDDNPTESWEEAKKYGQHYVGNFSTPGNRVSQMVFRPRGAEQIGAAALWELMCGVEIGDIVHLITLHPSGEGGFDDDFYVEGIHYEVAPMRDDLLDVTLTLDVSPRSYYNYNAFGTWDDSET